MFLLNRRIPIPVIATAISIVLISIIIKSLNLPIMALSIFVLYKLFYPLLNKYVFDSKTLSASLIFFCYIILLQCSVLITWIFNKSFPLSQTPALTFLIILAIYGYNILLNRKKNDKQPETKVAAINIQDIISLIITLAVSITILIAPIKQNPSNDPLSTLSISLISGNVDDAAHLGLVNDHLQFDRGITFGSDVADKTRNDGFYPASWHSVSALLIKTVSPSIKTGSSSLLAYGIQKLFWFSFLLFMLIRVSFTAYVFIMGKKDKLKTDSIIWISAATTLFGCVFLIPIYQDGFYSFMPQLTAALLVIPVIMQVCKDSSEKDPYKILPVLFLICFGGCLAWFLPLPAFAVTALLIVILLSINKKIPKMFNNLLQILKENAVILSVLACAIITQLIVMSSNNAEKSVSFINGLLLDGGIAKYDNNFFLFISIGFLAYLLFSDRNIKKKLNFILCLILPMILYCVFIYLVQMKYLGRSSYYYFKMFNVLTIILLPYSIVGLGLAIKKVCGKGQIIMTLLLSIIALSWMTLFMGLNISILSYAGGYRDISAQISSSLVKELSGDTSQDNYFNKKYTFYYVPGSTYYLENEIAGMIIKSNEPDSSCFNNIRRITWSSPQISSLLSSMSIECKDYHIDIITNQDNLAKFNQAVTDMGMDSQVKVKTY